MTGDDLLPRLEPLRASFAGYDWAGSLRDGGAVHFSGRGFTARSPTPATTFPRSSPKHSPRR